MVALAALVPVGGPPTGASMNPAHLRADLAQRAVPPLWIHLLGPCVGALLAAAAFPVVSSGRRVLTAELFHDRRYRSIHTDALGTVQPEPGRPA
ncbi:hypothetical protein DQ238_11190 [Geodermatophilus sp. TF02-6]|uniref:aquaporin n=1 Tax=Geodermatophilus sp. TF02-6 TaxID=2250575 RepID=UPI000DE9A744|nr:aquaporin [Geodermatophilus sp. TF02-6]RBY78942.1 hypothetical protein DQ238_11190 [Geodermatophilus sp. TF02-6]